MAALSPPGLPGVVVDVPEGSEGTYLAQGWSRHSAPGLEAPREPEPQPEPVEGAAVDVDVPPRAGRGSSREAWASFAEEAGVTPADGASRDDIIAACEDAGVIPSE